MNQTPNLKSYKKNHRISPMKTQKCNNKAKKRNLLNRNRDSKKNSTKSKIGFSKRLIKRQISSKIDQENKKTSCQNFVLKKF